MAGLEVDLGMAEHLAEVMAELREDQVSVSSSISSDSSFHLTLDSGVLVGLERLR